MSTFTRAARRLGLAAAAVMATAVAGTALAAGNEGGDSASELAAMASAKVSLSEAMAVAERETGGKAVGSGVENQDGKAIYYDVTIAKDGKEHQVFVDMQTGKVAQVAAQPDDEEGEGEEGAEGGN